MFVFRALLFSGLGCYFAVRAASAEFSEPAPLPASRYAEMSEKSPFALATPAEPTAAPQGSFAANWFVSGIARYGDSNFVTIKSRDQTVQFTLFGHEAHPDHHVSVASVNWSDAIGQSTVILQKGTETAKLEFNQALLRGPQSIAGTPQSLSTGSTPIVIPTRPGAAPALSKTLTMPPLPTTKGLAGNSPPIIVPAQAGRQFPASASNSGIVQKRVQIIAQPR